MASKQDAHRSSELDRQSLSDMTAQDLVSTSSTGSDNAACLSCRVQSEYLSAEAQNFENIALLGWDTGHIRQVQPTDSMAQVHAGATWLNSATRSSCNA